MGKKRKEVPGLQEALEKPWCYYCEREFNDLLNLSRHQKAKHFKCSRCGRRLNTAGGLSVHMQQVHKETLQKVENALEHRQGLEVEIFGMEGIPQDLVDQRKQRVIREFEAAAEAKRRLTGNPLPGMPVQHRPPITYETPEVMIERFRKWRVDCDEGRITNTVVQPGPQAAEPSNVFNQYGQGSAPGNFQQSFSPSSAGPYGQFPPPGVPQNPAAPGFSGQAPPFQPPVGYPAAGAAPGSYSAPGSAPLHSGKRRGSPGTEEPPNKRQEADFASSVDDLIADARKAASAVPATEVGTHAANKSKSSKDKKEKDKTKLVWPYEKIAPDEMHAASREYLYSPKPYSAPME